MISSVFRGNVFSIICSPPAVLSYNTFGVMGFPAWLLLFFLAGISRSSGVSSLAVSLSFPRLPLGLFELEAHPS